MKEMREMKKLIEEELEIKKFFNGRCLIIFILLLLTEGIRVDF